jgi:nucleoside-diphosphate-sugar epimerase
MNEKIIVTGASGFIGSALCNKLADKKIIAIDRARSELTRNVYWELVDLTDLSEIERICVNNTPEVLILVQGLLIKRLELLILQLI